MTKNAEKDIIASLEGTVLRVFLYALKQKDEIGVRETQKKLGFKTASLAQYHLHKLYTMGILEKNPNNTYVLAKRYANLRSIKVGILTELFVVKGWLIPMMGAVAGFLIGGIVLTIVLFFISSPTTAAVFAIIILIITAGLLSQQSLLIYKTLKD